MSFTSNLGEINLGEFNLGDIVFASNPTLGDTHRYWRINITDSYRDYAGFAEIELHDSIGGSDLTGGGTASVSSNYGGATYDASKAVDNDTGTLWTSDNN